MKKKLLIFATVIALGTGGAIYAFNQTNDCPLAGTKDCPEYVNCPKAGQPDCPIIANCPKKGQPDCPYANGKASCCVKK